MSVVNVIRPSLRRLRRSPGFTAISILTLALGIGGTTAVFSIVNAVLLRPLPYRDPEQLIGLWHTAPGIGMAQVEQTDASYTEYGRATRSFISVGGYSTSSESLTGVDQPERVPSARITATLLPTLGVSPMLGRNFLESEDRPGGDRVVILSEGLWRRRFGGDRSMVGRTIQVDGVARLVVGIMPHSFHFPAEETLLWTPLAIDRAHLNAGSFNMDAVARLRPGVTMAAALAEMEPLLRRAPDDAPGTLTLAMMEQAKLKPVLHTMRDDVVGDIRPVLLTVLGTVGFVLLIACANVANLFLVRAEGRQKEIAVRTAIGATSRHVAGLYLGESLVLTTSGAAVGIGLAWAAVRLLLQLAPSGLPRADEIRLDPAALVLTLAIAVVAGLFFAALPFLRGSMADLVPMLKDGSRGATVGRDRQRVRGVLVVTQVALALVLLVGSGLMARSFWRMREVDPGVHPDGVLTLRLVLPEASYPKPAPIARFYQQLTDRLAMIPGVQAAGATTKLPLIIDGHNGNGVWIEDHPVSADMVPSVHSTANVTGGYFRAAGIPILEGRDFRHEDGDHASHEAIVGRSFEKHFWPTGSALGRRIKINGPEAPWSTIVGVVGDVHDEALAKPVDEMIYFPLIGMQQIFRPGMDSVFAQGSMTMVLRTTGDPMALVPSVRREIRAIDANLPLVNVRSLATVIAGAMARTSFTLVLLGIAAGVALLLGAVGIYGVISYMVSLRTREIGVRMALGARHTQVRGMVVRQGMTLALIGVGIGLAGALALGRFITSLLYDVAPRDPVTLIGVATTLLAVAALASWIPARRAARIDPVEALRAE